jgi:hypothetical protein
MADNWVSQNRITKGLAMAKEMTKSAKRRNEYVSAVIYCVLLMGGLLLMEPWWFNTITAIIFFDSLHRLATLGFTSRSDNEQ